MNGNFLILLATVWVSFWVLRSLLDGFFAALMPLTFFYGLGVESATVAITLYTLSTLLTLVWLIKRRTYHEHLRRNSV